MSAELSGSIRPVSARYAAQIKELLTHQVRERIAEAEEAAARQGVEPGKPETVNPVRDGAEGTPATADPARETYRLAAPASAASPADASGPGTPAADVAVAATPIAPPPASLLDLKV